MTSETFARNIARYTSGLKPPIDPWLMACKSGHTWNKIISRIQINDKTAINAVKVEKPLRLSSLEP